MKCADLAGFGCGAFLTIKDANGTYVRVPQFCEYTMPTDDMPVGVRHGGKMKALSDQGAITVKQLGEGVKEAERECSHDDSLSAQGSEAVREFFEDVWTLKRVGREQRRCETALTRFFGGRG